MLIHKLKLICKGTYNKAVTNVIKVHFVTAYNM